MLSTIEKDIAIIDGMARIVQKSLPNWYGIEKVGFVWHGAWADPEIEYEGQRIGAPIVEDTMWERFREECEEEGKSADDYIDYFNEHYMREHADDVYELIELALEV